MPIELRGRISATQANVYGGDEISRRASFYATLPGPRAISAAFIRRNARDLEEQGFDSALYPVNSRSADVWSVAAEALSATTTLHSISAHRVGLQSPTVAARAFATLDRLSGGRARVHLILGSTGADQERDGDLLSKADRYRRALEYAHLFRLELSSPEPFDFDGEFYHVRGARSDVRPLDLAGRISYAGVSDEGVELAARYADVYAVAPEPLRETAELIGRVRDKAAGYGRTLRYWRDANLILAAEDDKARDLAERLVQEVRRIHESEEITRIRQSIASDYREGDSKGKERVRELSARESWYDKTFFTGLTALTGHGPSIVGSPATAAEAYLEYYRIGVAINTVGGLPILGPEDRELQDEFFRLVRSGAAQIDAERAEADLSRRLAVSAA
jgi:alkanesulfonate monooxygenase